MLYIDGFTLKMKSPSVAYFKMKVNVYMGISDLEDGLYGQAAFKNARAILVFEIGRSGQRA